MAGKESKEEASEQFVIERIFLKDLSFEAPMGIKVFSAKEKPKIDQELLTEVSKVDKNLYETVLKLTVTAKLGDDTAFVVEVHQAGVFLIKGIEGIDLARVVNTACMQILFPYAREAIDGTLSRGTFPPVLLPPVNFNALYMQALEQRKQQQKKQQKAPQKKPKKPPHQYP